MKGTLSGGDPALLRRLNIGAVLRVLRNAEPMTLTQIGRAASLSRQTVDVAIEELDQQGWIEEVEPEKAIGRPARRYRFRAESAHVLGIDLGVTSVQLALADLNGIRVATERHELDLPPGATAAQRCAAVRETARSFLAGQPDHRLRALCLGVPAIVDAEGRITLSTPLPQLTGFDLAAEASTWFDAPARVENDANLAALAEHWEGAAQGVDDFIELLAGHRIGSGLFLNGQLHRGRGGAAGEIGALAVLGWEGADISSLRDAADVAGVFDRAAAGDVDAIGRIDRFARALAQGAAAMILTVNPDLVVIGGGFARTGETLAAPFRACLQELCLDPPRVAISALDGQAVVLGAIRQALDQVEASLFSFTAPHLAADA